MICNKLIETMNIVTVLKTEFAKNQCIKIELEQQLVIVQQELVKLEGGSSKTWVERIKKSTSVDSCTKQVRLLQSMLLKLEIAISNIHNSLEKEQQFQDFLQPFRDAQFIIYDDGKLSYVAQTLQHIEPLNHITKGSYILHPDVFVECKAQLHEQGFKMTDKLPGDYDMISLKYIEYIKGGPVANNLRQLFSSKCIKTEYIIQLTD